MGVCVCVGVGGGVFCLELMYEEYDDNDLIIII